MRAAQIAGIVGVAGAGVAFFLGVRRAEATKSAVIEAVRTGGTIDLRLTGYYPSPPDASEKERRMEGGAHDRLGKPLYSLEDFFAGRSDHVSLAGDDAAWPYGQKVIIPWPDGRTVVGRVTDTGAHFRGAKKVYRTQGKEPIDVRVLTKEAARALPKTIDGARIVAGDHKDKATKVVSVDKFQGQDVKLTGNVTRVGLLGLDVFASQAA